MIKRILKFLLSAFVLYLLIVLESSIFHLSFLSFLLGLIFVIAFNVIESPSKSTGIFVALWAGLLIDIYSSVFFFGFYSIVLMAIAILLKLFIVRYVRIP